MTIDEGLVADLLRERYTADLDDEECPELFVVANAISGNASEAQMRSASEHLAACDICRSSLLALQAAGAGIGAGIGVGVGATDFSAGAVPQPIRTLARAPLAASRLVRRSPQLAALAAACAIAVLGVGAYRLLPQATDDGNSRLSMKGSADALAVAVQRGPLRFTAKPGDALEDGDRLGLFYTSAASGYLAVVTVDDEANASMLFPAGGMASAPVSAAQEAPLPDGAIVRAPSGCEWIVGVFSDVPLTAQELRQAIAAAAADGGTCAPEEERSRQLGELLPNARAVVLFPMKH